jgi:hypothetical protein
VVAVEARSEDIEQSLAVADSDSGMQAERQRVGEPMGEAMIAVGKPWWTAEKT